MSSDVPLSPALRCRPRVAEPAVRPTPSERRQSAVERVGRVVDEVIVDLPRQARVVVKVRVLAAIARELVAAGL